MAFSGFVLRTFGPVTPQNAEAALRAAQWQWWLLAVIQLGSQILVVTGIVQGAPESADKVALDPGIYAFGAYFVGTRKSRFVAAILLFFAVLMAIGAAIVLLGAGTGSGNSFWPLLMPLWVGAACVRRSSITGRLEPGFFGGARFGLRHVPCLSPALYPCSY